MRRFLQANPPAGHTVFAGDLYATSNGAWFGGGAFDPKQVQSTKVGTLTFDATGVITATLSYTVNGTPVVKNVTRQTWRFENLSGSYRGGIVYDNINCSEPSQNGHEDDDATFTISHNGNEFAMTIAQSNTCTLTGTYTQSGHMGFVANGALNCAASASDPAISGTLNLVEVERTISGFSGRFTGTISVAGITCSIANGRIGGVRR